jgi:nicotinate-nucleotide--dimethylbenzimidazole phosphoribosyltransferase
MVTMVRTIVSNIIQRAIEDIPRHPAAGVAEAVRERWDSLTKPRNSLGRLEEYVVTLAEMQNRAMPRLERRGLYVFCGDHGITEEGVSAYPSVVTREMVKNFVRGGAAINVLSRQLGLETRIVDAGVSGPKLDGVIDKRIAPGTRNFLHQAAMSREEAHATLEAGVELGRDAGSEFHIVGIGEMGIGNSTAASALLCALTGATPDQAVGRGAGLDDAGMARKREVLERALAFHRVSQDDPLAVLTAFGGFEIGMMSGFVLGAAATGLPIVVDGFICGAAFLLARAFYPAVGEHVFFGHRSAERGHAYLLSATNAAPLLDFEMRLGEGTGAALAIAILTSAVNLYREMATFAEASVSDRISNQE